MPEVNHHQATENPPLTMGTANLSLALHYLQAVVHRRLDAHFRPEAGAFAFPELPARVAENSPMSRFLEDRQPDLFELIALLVAVAPHVFPGFFDKEIAAFLPQGGEFPEIGGIRKEGQRSMMPTGETLLFLLAGQDLTARIEVHHWMLHHPFFTKERIVSLEQVKGNGLPMSGRLIPDSEMVEWLLTGSISIPQMSPEFPAQHLSSELTWDDLILDADTALRIEELGAWLAHHGTLMGEWGMESKLKPGYRVLFHGPPGTGKTLTATLLGKYAKRPVFRIDLSMIVSKYIGETEKNLSSLFDKAENKDWILFFDEADSLFGKRTNVRDAHDKYANQEVSYLLQRIESYPGLVILASNFKNNIDDAFLRRFQSVVFFPQPKPEERFHLWEKALPKAIERDPDLDLRKIAFDYELTGSNIMNVVQHCCIQLLARGSNRLDMATLIYSIRQEFGKEDKVMPHRNRGSNK
ncbi:MAG: ATP-binding protein [Bacteroidia bacterium]|nr:ATP-binding protein [Bacteroidia bacterium]